MLVVGYLVIDTYLDTQSTGDVLLEEGHMDVVGTQSTPGEIIGAVNNCHVEGLGVLVGISLLGRLAASLLWGRYRWLITLALQIGEIRIAGDGHGLAIATLVRSPYGDIGGRAGVEEAIADI